MTGVLLMQTMLKSFKEFFIQESTKEPDGNYVAIKCEDVSKFLDLFRIKTKTGEAPPNGDYHCTLIYSKETEMNPKSVLDLTNLGSNNTWLAKIDKAECFDSIPKDGSRDSEKSCIVLKLKSQQAEDAHNRLKFIGLKHSYPEYAAHVTLLYNMSVFEAHYVRDLINNELTKMKPISVVLSGVYSQPINKDYV